MPSVSCGYGGSPQAQTLLTYHGPLLWVSVGFDPEWRADLNAQPRPGVSNLDALVDTGAEESCIDRLLASQLRLPVVDRRNVCGVHGAREVDMHLAQVHIPALKFTVHGAFAGVELKEGGHRQQILLGRTFLTHFTFVYAGQTGDVRISY